MMLNMKIQVKNVTKKIGKITILKDVSLGVYEGDICGFAGPNGAGKTTLIWMIEEMIRSEKEIMSSSQICRYVDANFNGDDQSYKNDILDKCYDGLIFIDKTSNSEPNYQVTQ